VTRWLLLLALASLGFATGLAAGCDEAGETTSAAGGQGGAAGMSNTSGGGFVPDCEPAPAPQSDGSCVVLTTATITTTTSAGSGGAGGMAGGPAGGAGGTGGTGGGTAPTGVEVTCNPVAGGDCAEGEACDVLLVAGVQAGLRCAPPPNRAPLCGPCDPVSGPFCAPGTTCLDGSCRRFCCQDDDCPRDTNCSTEEGGTFRFSFASSLGICL